MQKIEQTHKLLSFIAFHCPSLPASKQHRFSPSHLLTLSLSHLLTFSTSHHPTFPLSYLPTFSTSQHPGFQAFQHPDYSKIKPRCNNLSGL